MFQNFVLHEQLECSSAATPRLLQLIDAMVEAGRVAKAEGEAIKLPARVLPETRHGFPHIPEEFDLATLYPGHSSFEERDNNMLKLELAAVVKRLDSLPSELASKENYIKQLHSLLAAAKEREEALLTRVNEIHQRTIKMRKHYGIEDDRPPDKKPTT